MHKAFGGTNIRNKEGILRIGFENDANPRGVRL
jgi:hypothetical protein